MAKYTNTLEYLINTKFDKTGINQLQQSLAEVQKKINVVAETPIVDQSKISQARTALASLQNVVSNSYERLTGSLDTTKLTQGIVSLAKEGEGLGYAFSKTGAQGTNAFNSLITSVAKFNTGTKQVSSTMDKLMNTLGNTVRWGVTASVFQTIQNSIYRSVEAAQELDKSLNDIRIVSDYSAEDMKNFATYANQAAQALGQTTTAYTNASLIFAQQGYDLDTSNLLADVTLKTANVTGQETSEVSEQLTALYNGFGIDVTQAGAAEEAVDKLAKVAAIGAADLEELAVAESKVASTANTLGVSQDQLAAQISTVISVTRESAETVGNAFRTIYARMGDLQLGLEDEGVTLGDVSSTLKQLGVDVLDSSGDMRNMGDVIEDLMVKWNDLTTAEKQAASVALAGKYQSNRLMALMENQSMYNEQLEASINSAGTLNEQQDIYMESFAAKAETLNSAFQGLFDSLFSTDQLKPFMDGITNVLNLLTKFSQFSFGDSLGGYGSLVTLGSYGAKMFSNQISSAMADSALNKEMLKRQKENSANGSQNIDDIVNAFSSNGGADFIDQDYVNKVKSYQSTLAQGASALNYSDEQKKEIDAAFDRFEQVYASFNTAQEEFTTVLNQRQQKLIELGASQDEINSALESANTSVDKVIALDNLISEKNSDASGNTDPYYQSIAGLNKLSNLSDSLLTNYEFTENGENYNTNLNDLSTASKSVRTAAARSLQKQLDEALQTGTVCEDLANAFQELIAALKSGGDDISQKLVDAKQKVDDALNGFDGEDFFETTANGVLENFSTNVLATKASDQSVGDRQKAWEDFESQNEKFLNFAGVKEAADNLKAVFTNDAQEISDADVASAVEKLKTAIAQTSADIRQGKKDNTDAVTKGMAADTTREAIETADQGLADQARRMQLQQQKKDIVELTASVGQLASAWGQFQNLGSLLVNDDLSPVEKAIAVVTNLVSTLTTLSQAVSGLQKLPDVLKSFSKLSEPNLSVTSGKIDTEKAAAFLKSKTSTTKTETKNIEDQTKTLTKNNTVLAKNIDLQNKKQEVQEQGIFIAKKEKNTSKSTKKSNLDKTTNSVVQENKKRKAAGQKEVSQVELKKQFKQAGYTNSESEANAKKVLKEAKAREENAKAADKEQKSIEKANDSKREGQAVGDNSQEIANKQAEKAATDELTNSINGEKEAKVAAQESQGEISGELLGQKQQEIELTKQSKVAIEEKTEANLSESLSQDKVNGSITVGNVLEKENSESKKDNEQATKDKQKAEKDAEKTINDYSNEIDDNTQKLKENTLEKKNNEQASGGFSSGAEKSTKSAGILAKGINLVTDGLNGLKTALLANPIGFIASTIGIAITAVSAINDYLDDLKEKQREVSDEALSTVDSLETSKESLDSLYDEYKKTGEASDDFKDALLDICETLGIQDASLLISVGKYDELIKKIEEAIAKAKEYAATEIGKTVSDDNDTIGNSLANQAKTDFAGRKTTKLGVKYVNGKAFGLQTTTEYVNPEDEEVANAVTTAAKNNDNDSIIGIYKSQINKLEAQNDAYETRLKQYDLSETEKADINSKITENNQKINSYNSTINTEDVKQLQTDTKDWADANFDSVDVSGLTTAQEILDKYAENDAIGAYFKQCGSEAEKFAYIINNTTDEAVKDILNSQTAVEGWGDQAEQMQLASGKTEEEAEAYAEEFEKKIQDNLDSEDILTLKAELDDEEIINNIDDIIERINNGENIEDIILDIQTTPMSLDKAAESANEASTLSDDDISNLQDKLDISTEEWASYQNEIENTNSSLKSYKNYIEDTNNSLDDQITQLKKQQKGLDSNSSEYKDITNKISTLNKQIDANNQKYKTLVARQIQAAKGAKQLADVFDDAYSTLTNTNSTALETADAIADLEEPVGNILGVDFSTWGTEAKNAFLSSTENLNLLKAAINGDEAALLQLQAKAAEEIMVNAGLAPSAEQLPEEAKFLVERAQEILPTLKAGATIDDTAFVDTLNSMLASGKYTEEQITAMLSALEGMGIDAHIDYKTITVSGTVEQKAYTGGATAADGYDPTAETVFASTTESSLKVPVVTLTKKPSGVTASDLQKNYNSGSGSGSGSSTGSGSDSGSSYEPQSKDKIEDEIDRYEKVNAQLEMIGNNYDKIASEQDRLVGNELVNNMNKQIDLLKKQINLQQQKLVLQQQEAAELQSTLASEYGISFDADGFMINYATVHQQLINDVNNLIDQYNNTTTEAGQEALEESIEAAQKRLDKFNETYQNYDSLWSGDLQDTINTLADLQDQIEDIRIEMMKTQIEAVNDIKELNESLIEFNSLFDSRDSDDPFLRMEESSSKLAYYFDNARISATDFYDTMIAKQQELADSTTDEESRKWYLNRKAKLEAAKSAEGNGSVEFGGTGYFDIQMTDLSDIMEQLDEYKEYGVSSIFGENSESLFEVAESVYNSAVDLMKSFKDELEEYKDAVIDALGELQDSLDERKEQYDTIISNLDHEKNVVQLLRGEQSYEEINKILDTQNKAYDMSIAEMTNYLETLEKTRDTLEESSEEWKTVNSMIQETQDSLNEAIESKLNNLMEMYQNNVNLLVGNFVESQLGTDIEWMNTQWELTNRNAEKYLDTVNSAYNIQKLQSQYTKLLNNTDSLMTQQKITQQMNEQLNYLREKDALSEYDVKYAQAQLDILQKQIALEEAQRNKSQMKLKRDSQGNYSYVYTANQDDISSAEDELLEAQNNAYNLTKDNMIQNQADALSALQTLADNLTSVMLNQNLTAEEKTQRIQFLMANASEYIEACAEQFGVSVENIENDLLAMVSSVSEENVNKMLELIDRMVALGDDGYKVLDDRFELSIANMLTNVKGFKDGIAQVYDAIEAANDKYEEDLASLEEASGTSFSTITSNIDSANKSMNGLNDSVSKFYSILENNSGKISDAAKEIQDYQNKISDLESGIAGYKQTVDELNNKLSEQKQINIGLTGQLEDAKAEITAAKNGTSSSSSGSSSSNSDKDKNNPKVGQTFGYTGKYYYDSWGKNPAGTIDAGVSNAITIDSISSTKYGGSTKTAGDYDIHIKSAVGKGNDFGWIKKSQLFDTGGYTGTWGSGDGESDTKNGKLAWLHQKEIVLNATDTENILAAVNAVRDMANNFRNGIMNGMLSAMAVSIPTSTSTASQSIDQNITINADFPNVTVANEIEEALLSLNSLAAQYAYRK